VAPAVAGGYRTCHYGERGVGRFALRGPSKRFPGLFDDLALAFLVGIGFPQVRVISSRVDQPVGGGRPETSASWPMPAWRVRGEAGAVEMRIWFDQADPPVGHLRRCADSGASSDGDADAIQFSGWLGLLRALSNALGGLEDSPD
jgi:hypothetical protein